MFESLFDDIQRNYEGPASYGEPNFSYINRSARKHYNYARQIINSWFVAYSREHSKEAKDLYSRFRSKTDEAHFSALTELYIHNLLISNGFELEVHPQISQSKCRPDFLAKKGGQPKFYVEVISILGDLVSKKIGRFESSIIDILNEIDSPDFFISLEFLNSDAEMPPLPQIKKDVEKKLSQLDYHEVCKIKEASNFPEWKEIYKKWLLGFSVAPKSEEGRARHSKESRLVGIISHPFKMVESDIPIKKRLLEKANKYGRLNMPFIIAANIGSDLFFRDDDSAIDALFGKEIITFTNYSDGSHSTQSGRNMKGVFVSPNKIRYTRLSGVLILPGLKAATLAIIKPTMWLHPQAANPLEAGDIKVRHKIYNSITDKMDEVNF